MSDEIEPSATVRIWFWTAEPIATERRWISRSPNRCLGSYSTMDDAVQDSPTLFTTDSWYLQQSIVRVADVVATLAETSNSWIGQELGAITTKTVLTYEWGGAVLWEDDCDTNESDRQAVGDRLIYCLHEYGCRV